MGWAGCCCANGACDPGAPVPIELALPIGAGAASEQADNNMADRQVTTIETNDERPAVIRRTADKTGE